MLKAAGSPQAAAEQAPKALFISTLPANTILYNSKW